MKLLESSLYNSDLNKALTKLNLEELSGKSVFITGGLGLICSTIVDLLLKNTKTKIFVGARNEEQFINRFGGYNQVEYVQYDALAELNLSICPDYIIHGAGLASPELYVSNPVETLSSNIDGVHNLLEFARSHNVNRLLYISSSEIYGNKTTDEPFIEGSYGNIDIDSIRSSYVIAKRAAEMMCKAYCSEYGLETIIVRPGHIFGPSAKETDKRISSDFAFKASRGDILEMKSSGLQKRSYCYSIDCAMQILIALLYGERGQAYNIGHDEVTSIRKMAEIYASAGNVKLSIVDPTESEIKMFNPMNNSALDNSKIKKLGYQDCFSVEEGLIHTVEILREME